MKINVHAGHNPDGKIACGAVGLIKESTQARKVKGYVIKYLKAAGHTVYDCTCNNGTSQSDVLNRIGAKCNAHMVDLDVSIHFNSGANDRNGNGKNTGTEVYVYDKSSDSYKAAENICKEISKLGFANRGVKTRTDLYVLNHTAPARKKALLVECCFVDDKDDANLYNAKKMAQAIVIGILNAFDSGIKKYSTRKINKFNVKGEKVGSITKGTTCNADMYRFINGYLMAHRKKNDNWVKAKYIR